MEHIKLTSGKTFDLVVCGITADTNQISVKFLPGTETLDAINNVMIDKDETEKIILMSESGEELAIYNGYTKLISISQELNAQISDNETGKVVTVVLQKPNEIESRLESIEAQMTDTQMALCDIYEGMV